MTNELLILTGASVSLGFIHTVFGPDHYLPFIVIAKARNWSFVKAVIITTLCGIGHILSSVILGIIGICLGIAVSKLEKVESVRGEIAAWLLIAFGFTYLVWGLHKAFKNRQHIHIHQQTASKNITPWVLFIIFVFGPCEPLIPLLMYPAAASSGVSAMVIVAVAFGLATISTMVGIVSGLLLGVKILPLGALERYSHALAGLTIFLCGGAIKFLGL